MHSSKLGLQVWAVASSLLTTGIKGQASMKLHRDLGITQKSAWHLAHRIRETWARKNPPFAGPAEADETYIGGKLKTMHAKKLASAATTARPLLQAPEVALLAPCAARRSSARTRTPSTPS